MPTLDDIARELSISRSTVCKALNGARDVSQTMRQRVQAKAVEMGYFRVRRTELPKLAIFAVGPDAGQPGEAEHELVAGFRLAAERVGYQADRIPLTRDMQLSQHYDDYMLAHQYVGGFFLGIAPSAPWMQDLPTCRTYTVLLDTPIAGNSHVTYIGIDHEEAMLLAVEHLKALEHRRIGYLSADPAEHLRCQAFFKAMDSCALPADRGCVQVSTSPLSLALAALWEQGCTAVICGQDQLASGVLAHCAQHSLRVPEDISVLGFGDLPLCQHTTPPLSTVRVDYAALGRSALFVLSHHFDQVRLSTYLLHPQLIPRSSCGAAPAAPQNLTTAGIHNGSDAAEALV